MEQLPGHAKDVRALIANYEKESGLTFKQLQAHKPRTMSVARARRDFYWLLSKHGYSIGEIAKLTKRSRNHIQISLKRCHLVKLYDVGQAITHFVPRVGQIN